MSQPETDKALAAEGRSQETKSFVRTVKATTRRKYTSEEKIRIVLEGFRREATVSDLCRRDGRRTSVAQFEENGGHVAAAERYTTDVTDFETHLTKLFAASPDALHIAPQSEFAAGAVVKQARELGYEGPIYGETVTVGTTAQDIAGDAATGLKAITAAPDPNNEKSQEVLANFRERYQYITLPWHLGSAYDDVHITAECLRQTSDDQDADGFRDCLYDITEMDPGFRTGS